MGPLGKHTSTSASWWSSPKLTLYNHVFQLQTVWQKPNACHDTSLAERDYNPTLTFEIKTRFCEASIGASVALTTHSDYNCTYFYDFCDVRSS